MKQIIELLKGIKKDLDIITSDKEADIKFINKNNSDFVKDAFGYKVEN